MNAPFMVSYIKAVSNYKNESYLTTHTEIVTEGTFMRWLAVNIINRISVLTVKQLTADEAEDYKNACHPKLDSNYCGAV